MAGVWSKTWKELLMMITLKGLLHGFTVYVLIIEKSRSKDSRLDLACFKVAIKPKLNETDYDNV